MAHHRFVPTTGAPPEGHPDAALHIGHDRAFDTAEEAARARARYWVPPLEPGEVFDVAEYARPSARDIWRERKAYREAVRAGNTPEKKPPPISELLWACLGCATATRVALHAFEYRGADQPPAPFLLIDETGMHT